MNLEQTMAALAARGSDATKKLLVKHGAREPVFGVKVGEMKIIHKKIKGDHALALDLYATGNGDAQYLAGMVADGRKMTATQIQTWADTAAWEMIAGTIVPWVASEHPDGFRLAMAWIDSPRETVAVSGWNTLSALAATMPDERLAMEAYASLLDRVGRTLRQAPDRVRYAMNGFVIACGTYLAPLAEKAITTARRIGTVEVNMGDTSCKVPEAESYVVKSRRGSAVAPKRKTMRC